MIVTTPLRKPASAPSEFDEAVSDGPGNAPGDDSRPREPASARSAFDESATREPVELLIEEARNRARRRRLVIGAVAAATVAVAAIALSASLGGGPPQSRGAEADAPAGPTSFGVFEPARGRIVYTDGPGMSAIDPTDPSSVTALVLPNGLDAFTPAGWSADGTRLALTNEHGAASYVLDADGAITPVPGGGGCCWFVTDPWLSPDGTAAIGLTGDEGDRLRLHDLQGTDATRVIELDPPVGDRDTGRVAVTAWSPDGARIAYAAYRQVGTDLLPSVYAVGLDTGSATELVGPGFGHIRQMAWSPDGSQLLVIAGPWRQSTVLTSLNPVTSSKATGIYLVGVEGVTPADPASALHPIAVGHYVAATWSPDGAQIAAIDFAPSGRRLVAMSADGSASRVLADLPANDLFAGVAWHPGPSDR